MTLYNEAANFPVWMHVVFWLHWYLNDTNVIIPSPQKASHLWGLFGYLGVAQVYNLKQLELFEGESDCKTIQNITPATINEMFTNYQLVSLKVAQQSVFHLWYASMFFLCWQFD